MQASASIPVASALPPTPTTQPFNPNADPDFLAYRIFHSRPLQEIIDRILANPDDVQMFSLGNRLQNALTEERDVIKPYINSLLKKSSDDRSAAESLILYHCFWGQRCYLDSAASKGAMFAYVMLALEHNGRMDEINEAAARNNPHALVATALDLIKIIYQRYQSFPAEHLSEEELQRQFNNLQKAASFGEPLANRYLGILYFSQESDFPLLTHIVEKPFQIPNKRLAYGYFRAALKNGFIDEDLEGLALEFKLFGVAASLRRFAVENLWRPGFFYFSPLSEASDHPEVIYHMGTLLNKFDEDPDHRDTFFKKDFQKIKENFNNLACTQTALFLQLLSWETEPDKTRIFNLLSESAKQFIHQYKRHRELCAQLNALTTRVDHTASLAASPFSYWAQTNANTDNDMKRDPRGRVVTAKSSPGKKG